MHVEGKIISEVQDDPMGGIYLIELIFECEFLRSIVTLDSPECRSRTQWEQFITAIRNKSPYPPSSTFYDSVESTGTHLRFYPLNYHSNDETSIVVEVPLEDKYADIFQDLIKDLPFRN